tara:strand:+ start:620 stop:736 length:117 start_codon:yes stop_codon:yes gene_type:complete
MKRDDYENQIDRYPEEARKWALRGFDQAKILDDRGELP